MRSLAALALLTAAVLASNTGAGVAAQEQQRGAAEDGLSFQERLERLDAELRRESATPPTGAPSSSPQKDMAMRQRNTITLPPIEAVAEASASRPSPEDRYFSALNAQISECVAHHKYDPDALCFPKLTPAKCEDHALAMIAGRTDERRTWLLCVRSCATESWWSRTFGECAAP